MKRFNIVSTGYDIEEVNKFIDVVINRLEKLNEENNQYLKKIDELKKSTIPNTEKIDDSQIAKAILAAEDTSIRMKELARREAEVVLEEAKRNANAIIHESLIEAQKNEQEAAILKKNIEVYKNRIKSLLQTQLDLVEDIDKVEL